MRFRDDSAGQGGFKICAELGGLPFFSLGQTSPFLGYHSLLPQTSNQDSWKGSLKQNKSAHTSLLHKTPQYSQLSLTPTLVPKALLYLPSSTFSLSSTLLPGTLSVEVVLNSWLPNEHCRSDPRTFIHAAMLSGILFPTQPKPLSCLLRRSVPGQSPHSHSLASLDQFAALS